MGFDNPIVGGTALRIPAIQSPNYSPGVSGWIIKINGDAEFNNLTIRGEFLGTAFIINSAGIFLYSSTPAAGNLVGSWASASGTDAYTNSYPAGLNIGLSGKPQVHLGNTASAGFIKLPTNSSNENDIATIIAAIGNSGLANEYLTLQLQGPSTDGATDRCTMQLNSQNDDASSNANFNLAAGALSLIMDEVVATLSGPRLRVTPDASALSALNIDTASGYTGNMFRFQLNGADRITANNDGILTTYATNAFSTYTPTVTNGGTATFTTQTGWYQRVGNMYFFSAYLVVNAAGSGASNVQIAAPVSIDRTTRQRVGVSCEGLTAGNNGSCSLVAFTSGSGATFDRLRNSTGTNITGADLSAGGIIAAEGWIRT